MLSAEPVKKFRFRCHSGLACFNKCCENVTIPLTPYDVFRLRLNLGITTSEFLRRYTSWHVGMATGLPVVVLSGERCPFVSSAGCRVYPDRPSACRLYPLVRVRSESGEQYYLLREEFCLGFGEEKEWSVEEWIEDQEAEVYNDMNDIFAELIAAASGRLLSHEDVRKIYAACFDFDDERLAGIDELIDALYWAIDYVKSL